MRYLDEFRDPQLAERLVGDIRRAATRPWTLMEVCGGQTHTLLRHGIVDALAGAVELIHGPGCPVCVTPVAAVDGAIELACREGFALATFGDMLRVPGSRESLAQARTRGGTVWPVYSPVEAVQWAAREPGQQVVFFAVGFETTAPATALAVRQAAALGLENFSLLVSHVRVQPAMEALLSGPGCRLDGFLAAGHVCTVVGYESYAALVERWRTPVVVSGFEPLDLLQAILACVEQLERGEPRVINRYGRAARPAGNRAAQDLMDEVFEPCDRAWRGIGWLAGGGLRLREPWARFDALRRFGPGGRDAAEDPDCRSGEVLAGRIKPTECAAFGHRCSPETPLGAPMVSSEGACAAYYRYAPRAVEPIG